LRPIITLLDMDGVLVKPGGYRLALFSVIKSLLGQMGLEYLAPGETIPPLFESYGVTSEWDMVPLTLAIALDSVARQVDKNVSLSSFSQTAEWAASLQPRKFSVDYETAINRMEEFFFKKSIPSESVLDACWENGKDAPLAAICRDPILSELLQNTRRVDRSVTTRFFQSFTLGAEVFQATYGFIPPVKVHSYLEAYDQPLLSTQTQLQFKDLIQREILYPAVYTARPSLQPKEITSTLMDYSPEAEIGLRLVGLDSIPLIGYGKLLYAAERSGVSADDLIKPASFQGLAGISAAWSGMEWPSLLWALNVFLPNAEVQISEEINSPVRPLPESFEIHVFEDSPGGLIAVKKAVEILRERGHFVDLYCWGISTNPVKKAALEKAGAVVCPDINAALRNLFERVG
jgi:hypothetical protein